VGAHQLEEYRHQLERIRAEVKELTEGLSEAQFNWRPGPDSWSIEECLEHLRMVGQWEVRAIETAVDEARTKGITDMGPFPFGPVERFVIGMSQPPVRQKLPAPRRYIPLHGQPLTAVLPTFLHVQSQLILQVDRSAGLDLRRVKVPTPISRFLRLSLGAMFAQIVAHERRHMDQARRVREKLPA
jgi:hypothetical protein